MKKLLLLIAMIAFIKAPVYPQCRLGYTENKIKYQEFPDETFQTSYANNGQKYIYWSDERILCVYYFDNNGICNVCRIIFLDNATLNAYVQNFNAEYVIISDNEWKLYLKNGKIIDCKLISDSDGNYFQFISEN